MEQYPAITVLRDAIVRQLVSGYEAAVTEAISGDDRHPRCFSKILSRIRDVKQHLTRKHSPEFYCDRCSTIFPNDQSRRRHVNHEAGRSCLPSSQLDGITHQQRVQMSRKSDRKLSEEEQWFVIWDIVFPGRRRPDSPYRDENISAGLYSFRRYCQTHGPALLDDEMQSMIASNTWSDLDISGEGRRHILEWALDEGLDRVFGAWRSRTSRAAPSDSNTLPLLQDAAPWESSLDDSGLAFRTQLPINHDVADTIPVGGLDTANDVTGQDEVLVEREEGVPEPSAHQDDDYIFSDLQFDFVFEDFISDPTLGQF
ncbi:hypothetical protein NEMBOFW57_009652 [Staphylotrichum longicolle]|uniref:C2H2-type domain-containing protein n=1 Tax=Staphylotrichum longicolle TaxID=669026 RepID=A0AAD4HTI7_9PEZI|nr:hypothetical protein NEMBOFW57_009652 [Staphylotrichum longicolle]